MTRFSIALLLAAVAAPLGTPALAQIQASAIARNASLWDANGKRVGKISRVHEDGSISLVVGEKLVRVPAATLTNANGKVSTSLTYKDLKRS
ncbi:hypothetical protein HJG53_06065 [Sphingomonas sp. ID1715]|uniref:hypothetical protein n=1 Tax=Sphingomonas sp. ID1715 TaxID=1656898 RepID=UPI001488F33F|nr:hypothetical protein [Sphingomonas sp. ID1715]NNM76466.1 hypothetical protein [Sphingomonas sp. ID1715]